MPEFPTSFHGYAKDYGHPVTRQVIVLAGFVFFSAQLGAAGLGEIRVLSALGERFDATVNVALTEGEAISSACFQVTPLREEGDIHVLRHARIEYRRAGQGGEVRIHGTEYEQEPLLKVALRLRCPEDDTRGITREYSVLLDPREYKTTATPVAVMALPVAKPSPATSKSVPAAPRERPAIDPAIGAQQAISPQKQARTPRTAKAVRTASRPSTGQEEFRLQLSTAPIDPAQANISLSEEQKLQLRERLLLLEADDQTAQLLQLKDRIARLEKQLSGTQPQTASQSAEAAPLKLHATANKEPQTQQEGIGNWLWAALGALLLIPLGFAIWRWRARKQDEQELFAFDSDFESTSVLTPVQDTLHDAVPAAFAVSSNAAPAARNEEWGTEDMDVVSPETVAEEAQLLLDHGLTRQAIELLRQETTQRPTALALWMKLFEAYCVADDPKGFEVQAQAFRERFVSKALWEQVQDLGRKIDSSNPLYVQEAQTIDELAVLVDKHEPSGNDDFDIIDILQHQAPEQPQGNKADESIEIDLPLEFHLPEVSSADISEWSTQNTVVPSDHSDEPLFDFDMPSLQLPPTKETAVPKPLEPEDFSSADPQMQGIARMIFSGQRDEACQQLEELLYRGSFEQRLLATKWLDKLLPVKNLF